MQYDILLTKNPQNRYSARPVVLPELVMSGESEAEVLARVRVALADFLSESRIVQVEVAIPTITDDPWLRYAGIWKDVPEAEWTEYLAAIDEYRREVDLQSQATLSVQD